MTDHITGIALEPFAPLFALGEAEIADRGARQERATACRCLGTRSLVAGDAVAYSHADNVAHGCPAARIECEEQLS